eukprot:jgi/Psemu1/13446/gm1.13446_g
MNTPDLASLFPSFDPALATFLHDSFDVPKESHSPLCKALINAWYRTWSDFLYIEYIDALAYHDGHARVPLTQHVQLKLQRFVDFGRHLTEQGLDWEEREHYTKKAFKDYCQGIVKARQASTADGERWTKPIAQLNYESWIRTPRDETTFPVEAAPVSSSGPVPVRPPAVGNIVTPRPTPPVSTHAPVHSTSSTPAVHNSPPTTACKTAPHPTVDNPETPTGLPRSSNPGSTDDSTSTGTYSYTWKYSPSTDSVRFRRITYSSTPSIVPADISTEDVPSKRHREPHSTRNRESHSPRAGTSYPPPADSRWTFYPQSETVVFNRPHQPVTFPQPSCISSLPLPPSGALSKDSVVPSSVHAYSPYGASSYQVRKPIYGAHGAPTCTFRKPLYEAHSMTYNSPAVCITKRHRDAIKLKLYHLHATLLLANWMYDDVT